MSLIGIDVGSTGTKLTAYDQEGTALGSVYATHTPHHPFPGTWELDPEEVWANMAKGLSELSRAKAIKQDPPRVIAICASTREGFPADAEGRPLGPCIMTADTRESGLEKSIISRYSPDTWFSFCGHLPERMDPICRMLWWKRNHPNIISKAKYFLGWGEFLGLRLTGHAVVDRSHAGRFFVYDFKTQQWSTLPQNGVVASPVWSRDSKSIYFRRPLDDRGVFRIAVSGGMAEKIADLKDWHDAGWWGRWMELDPTDAPLLLRDIGSADVYSLALEEK